jgi:predicted NACHT family NTPase
MLRRLVILLLEFGAGIGGNLVAGWIQGGVWENIFTPVRLIGTGVGAGLVLGLLAWLESERSLSWSWRWHRYWYLREVLKNRTLGQWETDFAHLELAQRLQRAPGAEVIAEGERRDLVEVLHSLLTSQYGGAHRALVLGAPGSGKTTGLQRLTLELAKEGVRRRWRDQPMPILVSLDNFQTGKLLEYVSQTMQQSTKGRSSKLLAKGIMELLEEGQVVLLFDALDEALGKRREVVLAELVDFLKSPAYEEVPVVITSRTREDPGRRLAELQVFEIQDLSDEAVEVFVYAYKQPTHSAQEIRARLEQHRLLESRELGRNPFWLRLIVESGVFEGNRGHILNRAVDTLLAREWDEKPETTRSWRRVLPRDV